MIQPFWTFLINISKFKVKIGVNRHVNISWCMKTAKKPKHKLKSDFWDDLFGPKSSHGNLWVSQNVVFEILSYGFGIEATV